jgi:5'-nucleotidase
MSFNRRSFIRGNALVAGTLLLSDTVKALSLVAQQITSIETSNEVLHIFHSNDMKGQVSSNYKGFGGLDLFHKNLKAQNFRGILLDGGGFLESGESLEAHRNFVEIMNQTGYHAATIGHAELSGGQDYLAQLAGMMTFELLNCNYEFSNPLLKQKVQPYIVLKYGKHRVGLTGVGPEVHIEGVTYKHPAPSLTKVTKILKERENCSIVVCLAQLGFVEETNNNMTLAKTSEGVDFIIGGNTSDTMGHGTSVVKNKSGYDVFVSHTASRASVFNHTSFATNKAVDIRATLPGIKGKSAMNELAALSLSSNQNQLT